MFTNGYALLGAKQQHAPTAQDPCEFVMHTRQPSRARLAGNRSRNEFWLSAVVIKVQHKLVLYGITLERVQSPSVATKSIPGAAEEGPIVVSCSALS